MSSSDPAQVTVHQMLEVHVEQALQLCREAGWNQISDDWKRLMRYEPTGCFVAMDDLEMAGTVTTTRYGTELAWIGMMLVHPQHRRRGVATTLMRRSIDYLKSQQVRCIKLDATPTGEKVYEKLEFEVEWSFQRWRREGTTAVPTVDLVDASPDLTESILVLDREAFGADRSRLLEMFSSNSFVRVNSDSYGMLRPGFLASYLGPVAARTKVAAEPLIRELCSRTNGTIFWDVPAPNVDAIQLAQALGFVPIRDLTRMKLGESLISPNPRLQYALADPATG